METIDRSKLLNEFNLGCSTAEQRYIALIKAPTVPSVPLELMSEAMKLLEMALDSSNKSCNNCLHDIYDDFCCFYGTQGCGRKHWRWKHADRFEKLKTTLEESKNG